MPERNRLKRLWGLFGYSSTFEGHDFLVQEISDLKLERDALRVLLAIAQGERDGAVKLLAEIRAGKAL